MFKSCSKFVLALIILTFLYSTISCVGAMYLLTADEIMSFNYKFLFIPIFYIPFFVTLILANKNFVIELKKEHNFLFGLNVVTFVFSTISFIASMLLITRFDLLLSLYVIFFAPVFYIPLIAILVISKLSIITCKKYPKITNVITFILNSLAVFFLYHITLLSVVGVVLIIASNVSYTNIKLLESRININNYTYAIRSVHEKNSVSHFPNKLPENAGNVEFFKTYDVSIGNRMFLKFDTNEEFINKELKKYDYKQGDNFKKYYKNLVDIMNGFDIYYLDDFYYKPKGIAINKNKNKIIYFYN